MRERLFVLPSPTSSNPRGRSFTITHGSKEADIQISNWTFCFAQVCNVPTQGTFDNDERMICKGLKLEALWPKFELQLCP